MSLKRKINLQIIFTVSCLAIGLLWINSTQITVGIFSPDNAYPEAMYKDLMLLGNPIHGWQVTKSPQFFPDLVLLFFLRRITGDYATAYYLCTVLYVLTLIMFMRYMAKSVNPEGKIGVAGFLFPVWALFLLAINANATWDGPLNLINIYWHIGVIPMGLLTIIMLTKYEKSTDTKKLNITVLVTSLFAMSSDYWWMPWFVLPLVSICIYYSFKLKQQRRKLLEFSCSLLIGAILGYFLDAILNYFTIVHLSDAPVGTRGASVTTALDSIKTSLMNLLLKSPGLLILTISFFLLVYSVFTNRMTKVSLEIEDFHKISNLKQSSSRIKKRKKDRVLEITKLPSVNMVKTLLLVIFLSWTFTFAICAIWGLWSGSQFRYFTGPITLLWITVGVILHKLLASKTFHRKKVILSVLTLVLIISVFEFQQQIRTTQGIYINSRAIVYPENISCIDEHTKEYRAYNGVASGSIVLPLFVRTKNDLRISQIDNNFHILHWLSSYYWGLNNSSPTRPVEINYIIASPAEPIYDLIPEKFGKPDNEIPCGAWNILFYLGDNSTKINTWFTNEMLTFLNSVKK
jgi:hypothetical protein